VISDYVCHNCRKSVPENAPCPYCTERGNPMSDTMTDEERVAWNIYATDEGFAEGTSSYSIAKGFWLAGRRSVSTPSPEIVHSAKPDVTLWGISDGIFLTTEKMLEFYNTNRLLIEAMTPKPKV
jgi:hypothetical protein